MAEVKSLDMHLPKLKIRLVKRTQANTEQKSPTKKDSQRAVSIQKEVPKVLNRSQT